jgi:tRNA-specific 2-thiouridylase
MIAVGLSGGVDSSVALALLKKQGHDVIGITMKIWDNSYPPGKPGRHSCFGPDEDNEIKIAAEVCNILDVPHLVLNCADEYKENVLKYFSDSYLDGQTPNPCVICNTTMKFGALLDAAKKHMRFDHFATGHYVGVFKKDGRYVIRQALDSRKDQSYFLCRLSQDQLSRVQFPLYAYLKPEIREIARKFNLPTSEIKDSQNFYSGNCKDLIDHAPMNGDIVDSDGYVVGHHDGYWNFTVGQKLCGRYVMDTNKCHNTVTVGLIDNVVKDTFVVNNVNFMSSDCVDESKIYIVKVRSSGTLHKCALVLNKISKTVKVHIDGEPTIITPGQFAVFYDGNDLAFSGVIK